MKKILHIAEPFATGVLSFLLDITQKQVEGNEVYILWGQRELTPENVESLFDPRIHLIKIDAFKGALGTVLNPKAYMAVRHWYNIIQPDIVHMHSSASGFVGRWSLPVGKTKAIYTPHGFSFLMQGGFPLKSHFFYLMEWISAFRPALIVACGKGEYEEARKLPGKSTYVSNGIRTSGIEKYIAFNKNNPVVCTSGRILTQKNPKLFNAIASLLPDIRFIWIGEGELRSELTAPNIEITGWVPREKALEIIHDSEFFILPSLWEGLPLSLLEAMYLKKVCLASNVIGNKDVLVDGANGFICNTAEQFAQRLQECLNGQYDLESMAEKAHTDVVTDYNVDTMANKYDELYNTL